ncbi:unnamed protein product [Dovyalis caffra]|uniref:Uncharacterized protein n=1 Tax=Dovyalis caffra TaxID=77055 RepID=A0AAV1R8P3_9ROSI|nr:unnamed protein product [Dovyalis caffra]CAK7328686.1 unnamed protein product [Dovyalis caffra]
MGVLDSSSETQALVTTHNRGGSSRGRRPSSRQQGGRNQPRNRSSARCGLDTAGKTWARRIKDSNKGVIKSSINRNSMKKASHTLSDE